MELENGFKIYHAGDSGVFTDMTFIGEYYKPDLASIPIGGHYTMDPAHAADAIINVRYMTTSVVVSVAELLVYGMAVKLSDGSET
jgi:L-ascorbate metabolism protein UlaG (beta-lactamase superfamily)